MPPTWVLDHPDACTLALGCGQARRVSPRRRLRSPSGGPRAQPDRWRPPGPGSAGEGRTGRARRATTARRASRG